MGASSEPTLVVKHTFFELVQQDDRVAGSTAVRSRRHTDSELDEPHSALPASPILGGSYFGDGEEIISTPCWSPELRPVYEEPALDAGSIDWQHQPLGWEAPGAWYLPQAVDYLTVPGGCGGGACGSVAPYAFFPMSPVFMTPTDHAGSEADWQWPMGQILASSVDQRTVGSGYRSDPRRDSQGLQRNDGIFAAGGPVDSLAAQMVAVDDAAVESVTRALLDGVMTEASVKSGACSWLDSSASASSTRPEAEPKGDGERTTVMMRNLPNGFQRDHLLALLDKENFSRTFDFAYLPFDFSTGNTLGYAFVNLVSPALARRFIDHFEGFTGWSMKSDKVCTVSWSSPNQGLAQHIERYRSSPVMHASIPDAWKPVLFSQGCRISFPPSTRPIKQPKVRCRQAAGAKV
eukprot:TRINITY_DN68967_c0_g1_i1.p1 TRINITY_DN68967_c0_g1~~TRINITY_DN68967_c0_g1_i1.p1  ORF type:complete len:442 (-),score=50.58 TRINITY_DN68967_c0_g1_i1:140-1354(-)